MTNYNIAPTPTAGNGAFGLVPGATQTPPSLWEQLNQNVPNYGAMTTSATGDISGMLNGQLSSSTMNNIGNYAASRGVALGQPNSPMSNEIGMGLTGTTTEGLQQQGLTDYNTLTGTAGGLQQNPALMSEISQSNAVLGSAPSPSDAASYAKSLYDQYLKNANPSSWSLNPAGGTGARGGGTASLSNPFQVQSSYQGIPGQAGSNPYQVYSTGGYGNDNVDMSGFY
jgi:hypothetical protein